MSAAFDVGLQFDDDLCDMVADPTEDAAAMFDPDDIEAEREAWIQCRKSDLVRVEP